MFEKVLSVILIFVIVIAAIGCGLKFWKGTDAIVEPAKQLYEKTTADADALFVLFAEADTHYKNIKGVFVDESGGYTAAYETQSDTKKMQLKAANEYYLVVRNEIGEAKKEYLEVKAKAENGYYDYEKLKDINLKLNAIIKKIPDLILNLKKFKN